MANFAYTYGIKRIMEGLDLSSGNIQVIAVMNGNPSGSNSTADTEEDTQFINGFSTLAEFNGSGYSRITLSNLAVNADANNDRAEFDADDIGDPGWGDGDGEIKGLIIYEQVTDDTDSIPLFWIDEGGFPVPGSNFSGAVWSSEGIAQGRAV